MKNRKNKKSLLITLILLIIAIIITISIINNTQKDEIVMTPKLSRLQAYEDVVENDELVYDTNGNLISAIQFDAFFLEDKNGDGMSEEVRGTCNEIGTSANFYMDLKVIEEGTLKNGTITINSNNFYFNTAIVKDNVVSENYISSNTKTINLNELTNGTQSLFIGAVRSGDYSNSSTKTSAIGNDTTKYSKENTVTFSGTYVDSQGIEHEFSKEIPFIVDWYGEVNVDFYEKVQKHEINDWESMLTEEGMEVNFSVSTTEKKNQLIMSGSYISGTIPELNGYKPISVTISGDNVTYEYNEETGEFTAQRQAVLSSQEKVIKNAYSSSSSGTKYNKYDFTVIYPLEAYETLGDETSKNFELKIPIVARNEGYNNPNEQDGFVNPYVSDEANAIITIVYDYYSGEMYKFHVYVGKYVSSPYYNYIHSKEKPLNIYNGISLEETDDTYLVTWLAETGTYATADGIIMKETPDGETTQKSDYILNTSDKEISMEEFTTNKGIYFSGATNTLGSDGWIKVYNDETNELIETFTSSNWGNYSSSNPYLYENTIKHIRVETSSVNTSSKFYVYSIKKLDDEYITENFTRDEFDEFALISTNLTGYMVNANFTETLLHRALYEAPTSVASITIKENTISTKETAENQIITIKTETSSLNEQKWKNGTFLVKLPTDIIYAEINSVTSNNENVKILAYDLYEENGNYFIKILTENANEETYNILVDCNLTPDPRMAKKTENVELYAINEIACDYYYHSADTYDVDGDSNTTEQINYRTTTLTMDPGTSLTTTQIGANYGDGENITIAPRVAKTDKNQRTATIRSFATNNYDFEITDVIIQGVIPFEGNDYVLTGRDLGSTYTTYMSETGIKITTEGIKDYVTVYYSTLENPSNDISDKANNWTLAENVTDWSKIKTYIIVLDSTYQLQSGETIEFEYDISIPEGIAYNEVTYSEHAIYFSLLTDDGKYATSTGVEKLGFMVAKQYDLEIVKYQEDTEKKIQGVTFSLTEEGQETSSIKVTDENGTVEFIGLFAERYYTLREEKTTDDYVLNSEEIKFYTGTQINEEGIEEIYLEYVTPEGTQGYTSIISENVTQATEGQDCKIQINIENEVKARLEINKTDRTTGTSLKNVKFSLSGEGIGERILTTDSNGNITISGLYLDQEYTLTETKSTGYYVAQEPIKFKITNENGTIKFVNYTDNNNITNTYTIEINDEIPTIKLQLQNDKIPTYGLQLTKYAKGEKVENADGGSVDKVLEGAQYKIYGEGIQADGKIYTTDENGILTIDGLYEYVNGRYITGEYTITEIYAPEGYALNGTTLKFRAYRENGTLKIEILEGQDVIRVIETKDAEGTVTESNTDLNIANESGTYPVIQIGVEDSQIFTLFKYTTNGTAEEIPIAGTKFVVTDLEGNNVTGTDGNIIGTWDETLQKYVLTTDENGLINANIPEGLYKAVEVYTNDKYILEENEEDRTYYFGIGESQESVYGWINTNNISGKGWDQINDLENNSDGGFVAIGEFSNYTHDEQNNGIDLDEDGIIDITSQGNKDSIIINYDSNGNYIWSKTISGSDDEILNKVIQTSDGGYAIVGYTSSNTVNYDGTEITELTRTSDNTVLSNKDAILLKIDKNGNYEWGIRFGGTADDEIKSVAETSQKQIVVVGNFYSSTMNIYEYNAGTTSDIKASFDNFSKTTNTDMYSSGMNGFVISYTETGKYDWSQRIGGNYDVEVVDVTNTTNGVAIATNHISTVYLDTNNTISQSGSSTSYTNGTVVQYGLDGTYSWRYRFYPSSSSNNIEISSIVADNNNIIVAVEYIHSASISLQGSKNGGTASTIVDVGTSDTYYDASLIELSNDGTYNQTLYTLSGNYDDYIADVKITSDGSILFGGHYYSTGGIDVDGDGGTTGVYDFSELSGQYTSDGFTIKINSDNQIEASSRMYGDGYDAVTSVLETDNKNIVAGGLFTSTVLNASSYKAMVEQGSGEEVIEQINLKGNYDGFITIEGISSAEVPMSQELKVFNEIKSFKITTEVIKHDENGAQVAGGNITGEGGTFGGNEYSTEGIRYVETVNYEEDSLREIIITPETGYTISYIKINEEEYTNYITNDDGTVTIPIFENVTEDKHIKVEFSNTMSSIEVNHLLWTEEQGVTTQKVADSESYTGNIGENYTTTPKTDIEYEIITNSDYYGTSLPSTLEGTDYYIPENATGTYTEGVKTVIDYYYKEKTYKLTVHHYIEGTEEQVPLKGSTTGETVKDEIEENLPKRYEYSKVQATEDQIDYTIYELVGIPENATGIIEEDTEVTFYYKIKTKDLSFTKVAEEDYTQTLEGTEFALYMLNNKTATEKDELIDTQNVATCWTLKGTYTTPEDGRIILKDLPINEEYRLVETKASEGRIIADGQWKIEFMYGEYDQTDTSIITIGGIDLKITAIGNNPPAFAVTEDGKLQLPNKEYFDFPTSGSLGTNTIYQIGIIIMTSALIILMGRICLIIKDRRKSKKRKRKKHIKTKK